MRLRPFLGYLALVWKGEQGDGGHGRSFLEVKGFFLRRMVGSGGCH